MVVVVMQPPRIPPRTGGFAVIVIDMRRLRERCPVEPRVLTIGLRPIRSRALVADPLVLQQLVQRLRAIPRSVVGHDRLDRGPIAREGVTCPGSESCFCLFLLSLEHLRVSESGAVLDDMMEVHVADTGTVT